MTRRLLVALALAFSITSSLAACGPSGHGDDMAVPMAIIVSPPAATLDVIGATPVRQAFTATAEWPDGSTTDITDRVSWAIDDRFGRFEGNELVSSGPVAGRTTATATLGDAVGTADVTIRITFVRVDPSTGAPPNAPDLFGPGSTIDPARAPSLVYPSDRVVVPQNIGDFDVHWSDASTNDVWEVSLKSIYVDIRVYVGATSPRWFVFTPDEWAFASGSPEVQFNVRGASTAMPGTVGAGTPRTAILSDQAMQGGLYYWAASSSMPGNPYGIMRHDVSRPGQPVETYLTNVDAGRCVACHVLSRDGTKMAVTYDGGDQPATLVDVRTRAALPSMGYWNYGAYTPSGDRLITAFNGTLDIRESTTGTVLGQVPTGIWATQPDFSPTGNVIAYAADATKPIPSYNVSFPQGAIAVQPYDAATGSYGTPTTIVPYAGQNNFYPSVSPDGNWVVFNRSVGDSYDDPDAELWVVPTGGGTPIRLDIANLGPNLTNSWTRWAPFAQTVGGEPAFWLTFSSKRDFGVRLVGQARPQIWMAAFFPDRAAMGMDPTGPAFRLPFQDITTNNHIAQWTEQIIPIE
jgi:hypothetical protein